jgi:hypothetical protein
MPRVTHTAQVPAGGWATALTALTFTAGDATNKERVKSTGREIIVFRNTGAGARTVTVDSVADVRGRTGSLTAVSIPAGAFRISQMFPQEGWCQTDGYINFEVEHAEVTIAVITVPS